MKTKYPGNHFKKYIRQYNTQKYRLDDNGYTDYARQYMKDNGFSAFTLLARELEAIENEDDWSYFENDAADISLGLTMSGLKDMAGAAIRLYRYYEKKELKEGKPLGGVNAVIPQNRVLMFREPGLTGKKVNSKRLGVFFLVYGTVMDIIVAVLLISGFFAHKAYYAKFLFGLIALMGIALIVCGILSLIPKRKNH
jgi:hypothetical protein